MDIVERLRIIGDAMSWQRTNTAQAKSAAPQIIEAAAEIERLRKELAQRPRIDENMLKGATDTAAMIVNELREQLAACQKDAERYRWVRAHCELIEYKEAAVQEDQDNLDAAIDAAMGRTE